jgi:8-amino-7-oxononanoate synthase
MNITETYHNSASIDERYHDQFGTSVDYAKLQTRKRFYDRLSLPMMFFQPHLGVNKNIVNIAGNDVLAFGNYNYLGLSGHPRVAAEAKRAIDYFGTSVSASRLVSGEIPLHRLLEQALARFIDVDDCLVYVSGHATNVSTIGHLFGKNDLILHDSLIHNSALEGCKLSGAKTISFSHNNYNHLKNLLEKNRGLYNKALIVVEGIYSMDGDIADLPKFIELKKFYNTYLMVDEAHSIGVLGKHGRGIGEHFNVERRSVDIWMGTLSKSLASCGGYIAGSSKLIEYLKFTAPGFVYSVGMTPSSAAAALGALRIIEKNPRYVQTLRDRSQFFLNYAKEKGLDTGLSERTPIVPVITGDSAVALRLSHHLFEEGIHVPPIIAPAVKNHAARLRFFVTAQHTEAQIIRAVDRTADIYKRLRGQKG